MKVNAALSQQEKLEQFIHRNSTLDTLRFITCGSVDDGKSTLIGRLLYESQLIFDDQVEQLKLDSKKSAHANGEIDFSLLVDGLSSEREQGITIDVAYRFFNTDKRKFIVADTPGHEQYTRNMVTGASTADIAVILIDARQGVLTQTKRHSYICSLMGIKKVILAINKMDLVDFDQERYLKICKDYKEVKNKTDFEEIIPIPLSALKGDNIIKHSKHMKWFDGPTFIGCLETIDFKENPEDIGSTFQVQWVNRPNQDFRGFSGRVTSGSFKKGDKITISSSGLSAEISNIILSSDKLDKAFPGQSVTLCLNKEIDASRGDIFTTNPDMLPKISKVSAHIIWLADQTGFIGRTYRLKIGAKVANAQITKIKNKIDINSMAEIQGSDLSCNDISIVEISFDQEIPITSYDKNKANGGFILIDRMTNQTVAAGMINFVLRRSRFIFDQSFSITKEKRALLNGHSGKIIWFTGLSGSGKSTLANALEQSLYQKGIRTYILDGDNIRSGLCKDLGFTDKDRVENIRRVSEVAKLMVDSGCVVMTSFISPFASEREMARALFGANDFFEVFVDVPLKIAEERDPKGLYHKARKGDIKNFTGIDSSYEAPENPEIVIHSHQESIEESVEKILKKIGF
jgi:bifunctional enzyme CysN/CysC